MVLPLYKVDNSTCLGYFAYLFTNQEVNDQAGNLITISLMYGWQRKGAGSAIMGALFRMDVSRSQYSSFLELIF